MLCEGHGGMPQGLLISPLDERQLVAELIERLTKPGNVAMPKNAHGRRDEALAHSIGDRILRSDVFDHCLGNGQANRFAIVWLNHFVFRS